jgi:CHASE2 domain-containing sensor protein
MLRKICWYVFLIVGIIIGLGAFGHSYSAQKVHQAIDQFPISQPIYQTLFVVWYMTSGVMLAFGAILVWIALRLKAGDSGSLFIAYVIGVLYFVFGVCALIYRHGDPFWALFIVLGALLVGSSVVLGSNQHGLLQSVKQRS